MCQIHSFGVDPEVSPTPIPTEVLHTIPSHPACAEALSTAEALLPSSIIHHSLRVYLYALKLLEAEEQELLTPPSVVTAAAPPSADREVLFVSCILHDLGASAALAPQPLRFETAGADAVAALLTRHAHDRHVREAWLAVALHTSPHVAEGAGGLVRALRLAVLADFTAGPLFDVVRPGYVEEVEEWLPRLDVERELGDAVVRHARATRSKAPGGSWPGDLLGAAEAEPGWEGVNKAF